MNMVFHLLRTGREEPASAAQLGVSPLHRQRQQRRGLGLQPIRTITPCALLH